ncbi:fosmidomycin resistance protein Fsr [Cupriavidus necator N-1]|uniref:Fosmidomycin resistance protein Fsr n=1 Tax=Cupriavidus necator (strain ATCC 43291 / DSM 13513 / CCUG 52238 / LMG 8453 / N-1) TaxID=1042878 RepID=G0ES13_CUPNN|nr:helix-turn-helix transcriptional regulator [Cupriavidus necator]AEI75442.1 fosmidomycin resistance protein Fsr [Cupriavidus necator N-1]MDX6012416.1 helix-turn-helix transcriptional regulator [Cupriavidus necator]
MPRAPRPLSASGAARRRDQHAPPAPTPETLALADTYAEPPPYVRFDRSPLPVTAMAADYLPGHVTNPHQHPHAQLIHAVHGVMVVATAEGQWIVPPTRGMWMPGGTTHWIRMVGRVQMRTAYIRPDAAPDLPQRCTVLGISALLRELILAAIDIPLPYAPDTRDARLMRLLLDEVMLVPSLPLHLPRPADGSLRQICDAITGAPDTALTLADWGSRLEVDPKTIQRRFARETGMTFGQWRQQARLLAALEKLAAGSKVVDVALDLGYDSPSAFATMFRRQFGVPPSAFFR